MCKMFVLNLMKKCWLASVKVLASSEKNAFCQCHLTFLCVFEGKYATIEFRLVVCFRLVDIGAIR